MHWAFLGAMVIYVVIVLALVAAVVFGVGYVLRKGWDQAAKPPS